MCKRSDRRYKAVRDRHYVPNRGAHGQQVHYLILVDGEQTGVISGGSPAWAVAARDEFFGIDKSNRAANLCGIVNNTVFRIEVSEKNMATMVLSTWRRRIAADWLALYGVRVAGFETFVVPDEIGDGRQRTGALYKADNWTFLGMTAGAAKSHAGSGGVTGASSRDATSSKLIFGRKVRRVGLPSTYSSTWRGGDEATMLTRRRGGMLLSDSQPSLFDINNGRKT